MLLDMLDEQMGFMVAKQSHPSLHGRYCYLCVGLTFCALEDFSLRVLDCWRYT